MSLIEEFKPIKYEYPIFWINEEIEILKQRKDKIELEIDKLRDEAMDLMKQRNKEIKEGLSILF